MGLRSAEAVSDDLETEAADDRAVRARPRSVLRSVATRIGGFVDRAKGRRASLRGHSAASADVAQPEFLSERRVMMISDGEPR